MRIRHTAAVVLASVGLLASATPADAGAVQGAASAKAVGCHGAACSGKKPEVQGCDADARTLAYRVPTGMGDGAVQLRYSAACRSAWVRVYGTDISDGGSCVVPLVGKIQRREFDSSRGRYFIVDTREVSLGKQAACYGGAGWSLMLNAAAPGQLRIGSPGGPYTGWMRWVTP